MNAALCGTRVAITQVAIVAFFACLRTAVAAGSNSESDNGSGAAGSVLRLIRSLGTCSFVGTYRAIRTLLAGDAANFRTESADRTDTSAGTKFAGNTSSGTDAALRTELAVHADGAGYAAAGTETIGRTDSAIGTPRTGRACSRTYAVSRTGSAIRTGIPWNTTRRAGGGKGCRRNHDGHRGASAGGGSGRRRSR